MADVNIGDPPNDSAVWQRFREKSSVIQKNTIVPFVWLVSLIVIGIGIAREFFIDRFGVDTPLQDLRHFALDAENSVPVWYSSALMIMAAALLWVISRNDTTSFRHRFSLWNVLAVIFVAMSIDETSSFHEVMIAPLQSMLGASGIFHFAWVIVAIPLLIVFAIYILPDLFRLPINWILKFMCAGAVYVTGALGMEMVGGYLASSADWNTTSYIIAATVEESLEILGLTMFVEFLISYTVENCPQAVIRFAASD